MSFHGLRLRDRLTRAILFWHGLFGRSNGARHGPLMAAARATTPPPADPPGPASRAEPWRGTRQVASALVKGPGPGPARMCAQVEQGGAATRVLQACHSTAGLRVPVGPAVPAPCRGTLLGGRGWTVPVQNRAVARRRPVGKAGPGRAGQVRVGLAVLGLLQGSRESFSWVSEKGRRGGRERGRCKRDRWIGREEWIGRA